MCSICALFLFYFLYFHPVVRLEWHLFCWPSYEIGSDFIFYCLQPGMNFSISPCESCRCTETQDPSSMLNAIECRQTQCNTRCQEVLLYGNIKSIAVFNHLNLKPVKLYVVQKCLTRQHMLNPGSLTHMLYFQKVYS